MIDFHSHLMPGLDDGADTLDEALTGVAEMMRDGITRIITTPHLSLSLLRRRSAFSQYMDRMDSAWTTFHAAAAGRFPEMRLDRGVELALDSLPSKLTDDRIFLAGTRFMLVEFPHFRIPPNSEYAVRALVAEGIVPVFGHPERYRDLSPDLDVVRRWKQHGALLQVNAGALFGQYGEAARQRADALITQGLADYLSSDYHARGTCSMRAAALLLNGRGMGRQARALTETNAARMLAGDLPQAIGQHVAGAGFLRRLVRRSWGR